MNKYDIIQLKRAAIVMKSLSDGLVNAETKNETLMLTAVIVKAARELELTQEEI